MPLNNFFTASELAREMETGEASVRFWLSRFSRWLPHVIDQGQKLYTQEALSTLLVIAENIDSGMVPSGIETLLDDMAFNAQKKGDLDKKDGFEKKSLDLIESLLGTMVNFQERIANAQERRAETEEKKALAMERRAEAEEKKALAINAIAKALQGMDQGIISKIGSEEKTNIDTPPAIFQDDLSPLPDWGAGKKESLDDIAMLMDDLPYKDKGPVNLEIEDLSLLFDKEPYEEETLDKLGMLLDDRADTGNIWLDDLGMLVEDSQEPLDDLAMLVEENQEPLDDLAMLVEENQAPLDDLAMLVEENREPLDDLGMLVTKKQTLRPSIKPEDNFELYKSEIINIIIHLKNDGLTVEETTEKFNTEKVLTLSGKSLWSSKSIAQIYKFIDAVKK